MKKKRLAALAVAFALVLSLSVSAFALGGLSIGDFLQIVSSIDTSKYTEFNEQEWSTMTPAERAEQFNFVISDQKGTSNITSSSDFINDSDLSYRYYCDLIHPRSGVNPSFGNLWAKTYLENNGLADFGMGYHNSDGGHSGSKFGDGTVADTLNDDFLNYMRDNPQNSDSSVVNYIFENGCSASLYLKYVNFGAYDSWTWCLRLVDSNGNIVFNDNDIQRTYRVHYGWTKCEYDDYSIAARALSKFYFDNGFLYTYKLNGELMEAVNLKDYLLSPCFVDDNSMPAIGTDENGNQIQFNINSDGVTYEGSTYNYNDDNSVTINGNTYYITVNPKDVDEDYYKQFLQQVINNYYNYYNTDSTPFDDKDIISAVKSVFTSLETFRSYCYSQLKQLSDYVFDGFNSLRSSVKSLKTSISDKLDDIIKILKNISNTVDDISEEKKQEYNTKWLEAIGKVKKKFCYDEIKANIDNCYNAMFNAEYSETEQAAVVATFAYNDGSGAEPVVLNGTFLPAITVEIFGQEYNLLSCIGSFTPYMDGVKDIISMFLIITFIISLFRSLPAMIGSVAGVVTSTPQFQDFSDKTEVDFYRSKYDR